MLRAVSITVARQLHAIFVAATDRGFSLISTLRPTNPLRPPLSPPPPLAAPRVSLDFSRAPIFPPFSPEPQNGAKIQYRFAEAGLAADRATDGACPVASASMKKYLLCPHPFCFVVSFRLVSVCRKRDARSRGRGSSPAKSPGDESERRSREY